MSAVTASKRIWRGGIRAAIVAVPMDAGAVFWPLDTKGMALVKTLFFSYLLCLFIGGLITESAREGRNAMPVLFAVIKPLLPAAIIVFLTSAAISNGWPGLLSPAGHSFLQGTCFSIFAAALAIEAGIETRLTQLRKDLHRPLGLVVLKIVGALFLAWLGWRLLTS
jgi:hypothetical protein